MTGAVLRTQVEKFQRKTPDMAPGNTVRVHERVQEGDKERVQIFEGLIIGMHKGHVPTDRSFTVRKIVSGIGVEKVFPIHSPMISKIQVTKEAKVRRAKLNFLRGRKGKSARLNERFTESEEFGQAVAEPTVEAADASAVVAEKNQAPETKSQEESKK